MLKKPLVNNQIRASQVRVIDETGKQMGIFKLEEALQIARERNLDLIQVTEKVEPPVCKLGDYGKYLYWIQKKEKGAKKRREIKTIRFGFGISLHDLKTRANLAENFLKKGEQVKIEMILRGREKELSVFAKEKMRQFLKILEEKVPIKIDGELKTTPKGLTTTISKA